MAKEITGFSSIQKRILITGEMVLQTPAHFGDETAQRSVFIPILRDPLDNRPMITGSSIAGALRHYISGSEWSASDIDRQNRLERANRLFGIAPSPDVPAGRISPLVVNDAVSAVNVKTVLRDGIAVNTATDAAKGGRRFIVELLPAETCFLLSFELEVPDVEDWHEYVETFAYALYGLQVGEIRLGLRKRRGYGRCAVRRWEVRQYDLTEVHGLLDWLRGDDSVCQTGTDILQLLLEQSREPPKSGPDSMQLVADFEIDGSLMVRSSGSSKDPDTVQLQDHTATPVIPGTSLAGALRHRAFVIANTIAPGIAKSMVDDLFGAGSESSDGYPQSSRLWVDESHIKGSRQFVQHRIALDRFTGGVLPGRSFDERPVFGGEFTLHLKLERPQSAEVGLILLLLKDLWTGDLSLGGEKGIGRGRLKGIKARLDCFGETWSFQQIGNKMDVDGDRAALERFVRAIPSWTVQSEPLDLHRGYVTPFRSQYLQGTTFPPTSDQVFHQQARLPSICETKLSVEPLNLVPIAAFTREWLIEKSRQYGLAWFLGYLHDGVIWGYFGDHGLSLSSDVFPRVSPPLVAANVQQIRLFSDYAELLVWQTGADYFSARLMQEGKGTRVEYFDTSPFISGSQVVTMREGFVLFWDKQQGSAHAPPLQASMVPAFPARLLIRHYISYEPAVGQAYVSLSRLAGITLPQVQ